MPPVRHHRILIAALLSLFAGEVSAQDEETRFARIAEDGTGNPVALQLAVVTYQPQDSAYSVDLVSAIHIGDEAYYAVLNERFRHYDALLYELVAPEGGTVPSREVARSGFISGAQLAMTGALGLAFQLEEIDYSPANFVHADLSPELLARSMEERGESLYVYFWRLFFAAVHEMGRDPLGLKSMQLYSALLGDDDQAFKIAVAHELVDIDRHRNLLAGENGSAVIDARNERALDVLRETIDGGATAIGIFYGVAHMPDFDEQLREQFGLLRRKTVWVDAWALATPGSVKEQ